MSIGNNLFVKILFYSITHNSIRYIYIARMSLMNYKIIYL